MIIMKEVIIPSAILWTVMISNAQIYLDGINLLIQTFLRMSVQSWSQLVAEIVMIGVPLEVKSAITLKTTKEAAAHWTTIMKDKPPMQMDAYKTGIIKFAVVDLNQYQKLNSWNLHQPPSTSRPSNSPRVSSITLISWML